MNETIGVLLFLPAIGLFIGALWSVLAMLPHRNGALGGYLFNGWWFLDGRRFTPAGQPAARRFRLFFAAFMIYVLAIAVGGVLLAR